MQVTQQETYPGPSTYCHLPTMTQKHHYTVITTPSGNYTVEQLRVTHNGVDSHYSDNDVLSDSHIQ